MQIQIDKNSRRPVYDQIAEQICREIESGRLREGDRLPTVRDLADHLGIARGTVKHAYDKLEAEGRIRMVQGRGTFVSERETPPSGKKDRAVLAIERLLDELTALGFSAQEIRIFFGLKLREREEHSENILVTLIDCNPEALWILSGRLSSIPDVALNPVLLHEALESPQRLSLESDLIITTDTHYPQLRRVVDDPSRLMQIVLTPSRETIVDLAKSSDRRTGVLCESAEFGQIVRRSLGELQMEIAAEDIYLFRRGGNLRDFLFTHDTLIVPPGYLRLCTAGEGEAILRAVSGEKSLIHYDYQIDGGSLLQLKDWISDLRRKKNRF